MKALASGKAQGGAAEPGTGAESETPGMFAIHNTDSQQARSTATAGDNQRRAIMGRIPALDGIRAIAVLLVMTAHGGLGRLVPGGLGVTVFFFLSGYLITSLMRSENSQMGTISLVQFYIRRTFRILPPLYISLALCGLLIVSGLFVMPRTPDFLGVVSQILFFQNYSSLFGNPVGVPLTGIWSLAVEEHFYMIFPALYLLWLRKLSQSSQIVFCLCVCAVALCFRFYYAETLADFSSNYNWSHTRIDSIVFGVLLALANNPKLDRNAWRPSTLSAAAAGIALLLTLVIRDEWFRQTLRYSFQGLALYVLFSFTISNTGRVARLMSSPPAVIIARYSYTLYLVHLPLLLLSRQAGWSNIPTVTIAYMLAFAYAATMYRFVEKPLAVLRHRLHREKTGTLEKPVTPADLHEKV